MKYERKWVINILRVSTRINRKVVILAAILAKIHQTKPIFEHGRTCTFFQTRPIFKCRQDIDKSNAFMKVVRKWVINNHKNKQKGGHFGGYLG